MIATTSTTHLPPRQRPPERTIARRFLAGCRPPRRRTLREFAEQEIVIPSGRYKGLGFRCATQPYAGLFFGEVDSGRWRRTAATGCVQSGKTLLLLIVLLYHLFEVGEDVIFAVPKKKLAHFKWRKDIQPIIGRTRYKHLIPTSGVGSRGGNFESITFGNGATLIFMSGSGADEERSSITSRVVVVTEADKMDEPGKVSQEADPITQLEARTESYGADARVYLECTVSDVLGRIWREYQAGTASRIVLPCPECGRYVDLERKDLVAWEDAASAIEAEARAAFGCPACGILWRNDQRKAANRAAVLLHRGQSIDDAGHVSGDPPPTHTLGFRWGGAHNLFWTAGDLGRGEWIAMRSEDAANAERGRKQFYWTVPDELSSWETVPLTNVTVAERCGERGHPRGQVPADTLHLASGCDVGMYLLHWATYAIDATAAPHCVDYGILEVKSKELGFERALMIALAEYRGLIETGYTMQGSGEPRVPDCAWIDSGYHKSTNLIYQFVKEAGPRYRAVKGYGIGQHEAGHYTAPTKTSQNVKFIGDHFHAVYLAEPACHLFHCDANYWKSYLHQRIRTEPAKPGAFTLFHASQTEHLPFAKHLTNETEHHEWTKAGLATVWKHKSGPNHWLDASYMALAAGHFCGARLVPEAAATAQAEMEQVTRAITTTPDGRPFLLTER